MKPRSLSVFVGVIALLAITLGVGWGGPTLAGPVAARDTSVTVSQGLGNAVGPAAQSLARAAHPGPPRRVGRGPKLPRGARRLRALSAATKINVDVMLAPSDEAALTAYAANVSSPGNALYHHYLTVSQFAAMFGPSAAAVSAVEASLRADGLTPGPLSANHLMLPVTATAKQLAAAFSTSFDQYQLAGGQVAFANTEVPLVSGAAAPYVSGIIGLDTLSKPQPLDTLSKPQPLDAAKPAPRLAQGGHLAQAPHVVTGGPQPCAAAISAGAGIGSYTADQVASAYNFSGLYQAGDEGAGVTVAIVEFEPNLTSDIAAYQQCYGTSATVNYIQEDGGPGLGTGPDPGTGGGEAVLDIENVIGLAPKATVDVYQAPLTFAGYIDLYTAIMDNSAVRVVSTSWGGCETLQGSAVISAENSLFLQASIEGKSVFAASGDDGPTDCAVTSALAVDDPGS
jgi:subtilase family serine protease